ncbi:MAG: hypothetical protein GX803_02935 [Lentisphaerae bacterium]|jgi:hypothetical protein|nr:hypothetical protein [Lentisphaerota bacterium]
MDKKTTQDTPKKDTPLALYKLTPTDQVDNIETYQKAIDFVFDSPDLHNIALSGPYGAGKSSVLESYKKRNKKKRFIHISLTDFDLQGVGNTKKALDNIAFIERKILSQLLHQIKPSYIPLTAFHLKNPVTKWGAGRFAFWIITTIALLLYQFKFTSVVRFIIENEISRFEWIASAACRGWAFVAMLIAVTFLTYKLIWYLRTTKCLRKIAVQGNEIELNEKADESLFDKYLNEVLYLLNNANVNAIVFENFDRLQSPEILVRLREVNQLVNVRQNTKRSRKKRVRFFYLVRDDMFTTKDRTKFFDLIIPVVPVIDSSNSYDMFLTYLKEQDILDRFDEYFLRDLSLYIDEMRILRNIINEYVIYNRQINTTNLDHNRLLALITYKNLFPKDFTELQLDRGFVAEIFRSTPSLLQGQKELYENRITEIDSIIETASYKHPSLDKIDKLESYLSRYAQRPHAPEIKDILLRLRDNALAKQQLEKEGLSKERDSLTKKLSRLAHLQLKDTLDRSNITEHFNSINVKNIAGETELFLDVKGNHYFDLLKYLLRSGYIDETYPDYLTYFYPASISHSDMLFLRSITDQKAFKPDYKLNNPDKLYDRISDRYFLQPETINHDLFDYLVSSALDAEHRSRLSSMVLQLHKDRNYRFIINHFQLYSESKTNLISAIHSEWPTFLADAIPKNSLPEQILLQWVQLALNSIKTENILQLNQDSHLANWTSDHSSVLIFEDEATDNYIENLYELEISFSKIDDENVNRQLMEGVYEHSLYDLNTHNIEIMLKMFYQEDTLNHLQNRWLSAILSESEQFLAKRVANDLDSCLNLLLDEGYSSISDDDDVVLQVLNSDKLTSDTKKKYIQRLSVVVSVLNTVSDHEMWSVLLENNKLAQSLPNIVTYFANIETELDQPLINFINSFPVKQLDFSNPDLFQGEDLPKSFFDNVLLCNDITLDRYKSILSTLPFQAVSFDSTELDPERVRTLINIGMLEMNLATLEHIREHYGSCTLDYIHANFDEYTEISDLVIPGDEIMAILNDNIFSEDQKKSALSLYSHSISIRDYTDESDDIFKQILENHFYEDIA